MTVPLTARQKAETDPTTPDHVAMTDIVTDTTTPDSVSHLTDPTTAAPVTTTDPLTAIAIQTLSQAVEMLREDVERERDRADRAERQVEEGRNRIDKLLIELADARTAAMISGCEAAVLRTQLAMLTERRPWWRRWLGDRVMSRASRHAPP